jgi:HEAT repeat protein
MADREPRLSRAWVIAAALLLATLVFPFVRVALQRASVHREVTTGLASVDPATRLAAARAIGRLGPVGEPALVDLLDDGDRDVSHAAVVALADGGRRAAEAVFDDLALDRMALATGARTGHIAVLSNLRLTHGGRPAPIEDGRRLVDERLRSSNPSVRATAALARYHIERFGNRGARYPGRPIPGFESRLGESLPAVIDAIDDLLRRPELDHQQRQQIARMLGYIGGSAVEVLAQSVDLGQGVTGVLGYIGHDAVEPVAREATNREATAAHRRAAVSALGSIFTLQRMNRRAGFAEPDLAIACRALVAALDDPDLEVRRQAIRSLGQVGPDARGAVDAIAPFVTEGDTRTRATALGALREIGASEGAALDAMIAALDDNEASVRNAAVAAIAASGSGVIPPLEQVMTEPSDRARLHAARVLAGFGAEAVPSLERLLATGSPDTRRRAADALRAIGPASRPATGTLVAALADDDARVRGAAAHALYRIGATSDMLGPLSERLTDDARVAQWAARAIETLGEAGRGATAPLVEATAHESPAVRAASARALGRIDADASTTRTALRTAAQDADRTVSWEALWALDRLDAASVPDVIEAVPHRAMREVAREFGSAPDTTIHVLLKEGDARRVCALDGHGRITSTLEVPDTTTAINRSGASILIGQRDGAGRIDVPGSYARIPFRAVEVADLTGRPGTDEIIFVTREAGGQVRWRRPGGDVTLFEMHEQLARKTGFSIAATGDDHVIVSTRSGVRRAGLVAEAWPVLPILTQGGRIAADPRSNRWAAVQGRNVHLFEGDRERQRIAARGRAIDIAYSGLGTVVVMHKGDAGLTLDWLDEEEGVWRSLALLPPGVIGFTLAESP